MLIDVSIYSPISALRHLVVHFPDELPFIYPPSRPRYVLTQRPLSMHDSLGHGLMSCAPRMHSVHMPTSSTVLSYWYETFSTPQQYRVSSEAAPHYWKVIPGDALADTEEKRIC
ncbi:hypothetical protein K503DRAFT_472760 [Rhizopogon vinicolor AM-OR11-026]|uniref:Uncharacterized protein n=1 Tax=Rhizopogon vinicolor AM-OR11-026 TaxID=1314800 RepID=A0A1B7MNC2_9AGAM|nr:hypothetical protein K503DRAFT_472760 [Rhizopogon vinicolor AM-OR11-026]